MSNPVPTTTERTTFLAPEDASELARMTTAQRTAVLTAVEASLREAGQLTDSIFTTLGD